MEKTVYEFWLGLALLPAVPLGFLALWAVTCAVNDIRDLVGRS